MQMANLQKQNRRWMILMNDAARKKIKELLREVNAMESEVKKIDSQRASVSRQISLLKDSGSRRLSGLRDMDSRAKKFRVEVL